MWFWVAVSNLSVSLDTLAINIDTIAFDKMEKLESEEYIGKN